MGRQTLQEPSLEQVSTRCSINRMTIHLQSNHTSSPESILMPVACPEADNVHLDTCIILFVPGWGHSAPYRVQEGALSSIGHSLLVLEMPLTVGQEKHRAPQGGSCFA